MIVALGLSHHTAPVALRERFALTEARVPATLAQLRDSGLVEEAVVLSTCNRVELYAATSLDPKQAFPELIEILRQVHDYRDPLTDEIYQLAEPHSVEHLFKVA
jgi:glutamyl-tRNA reductase